MTYSQAEKGEIRADLTALYTAGKKTLPQRAQDVAGEASTMSGVIDSANLQCANMGDHPVFKAVLNLAIDCQHGVNRSVTTLNNLAAGVVAVADEFVGRDDYARTVFDDLQKKLGLTPELGDRESDPVDVPGATDRDSTVADGAPMGPHVQENPDVESPEDDREERNETTDEDVDGIGIPDET